MSINKDVIAQRKSVYGSNFEAIAKVWSEDLSMCEHGDKKQAIYFTPIRVARYMALMKQCRIDAIDKKLSEFPHPDVALKLTKGKEDSIIDRDNYNWIADNYKEYLAL